MAKNGGETTIIKRPRKSFPGPANIEKSPDNVNLFFIYFFPFSSSHLETTVQNGVVDEQPLHESWISSKSSHFKHYDNIRFPTLFLNILFYVNES